MKKLIIVLLGILIVWSVAANVQALPYSFTLKPDFIWTAPTQNTDGSVYDDQGGYVIYCKPASQPDFSDALSFRILDFNQTIIQAVDYPCLGMPGQIDFAVTAIDTAGNESDFSNVVSVPLVGEVVPVAPTGFQ